MMSVRRHLPRFLCILALSLPACSRPVPGLEPLPPGLATPEPVAVDGLVTGPASPQERGAVAFTIRWPQRRVQGVLDVRVVRVEVRKDGQVLQVDGKDAAAEVFRSAEPTASARVDLPAGGPYLLDVRAFKDDVLRDEANLVASGSQEIAVRSNELLRLSLKLKPTAAGLPSTPTPAPSVSEYLATPGPTPTPAPEDTPPPPPTPAPQPSGDELPSETPAPTPTPAPGGTGTPPPEPTPAPLPSNDALPTAAPTAAPTPTSVPTPSFRQVYFDPAYFLSLYVPAPPDVTETAGLPSTALLRVFDQQTGQQLDASLFWWTSSAAAVATVSAGGLVQAVAESADLVKIEAVAKHNSNIRVSTWVRVHDRGAVELTIE